MNNIDVITAFHWDYSPADLEWKSKSKSLWFNFRAKKVVACSSRLPMLVVLPAWPIYNVIWILYPWLLFGCHISIPLMIIKHVEIFPCQLVGSCYPQPSKPSRDTILASLTLPSGPLYLFMIQQLNRQTKDL